jgi:glycosyltransferase involved in cell wall biosynthesis
MTQEGRRLTYVLITPARNEREFIGACIRSVVAQELPPARWIIVSDGSTDGTDEIVDSGGVFDLNGAVE